VVLILVVHSTQLVHLVQRFLLTNGNITLSTGLDLLSELSLLVYSTGRRRKISMIFFFLYFASVFIELFGLIRIVVFASNDHQQLLLKHKIQRVFFVFVREIGKIFLRVFCCVCFLLLLLLLLLLLMFS